MLAGLPPHTQAFAIRLPRRAKPIPPGVGTMVNWDQVRQQYGLSLSDDQKAAIRQKLPPSPEPGVYFADGVFEGGGVLGTAFLGAARCCDELGIRWKGLAGTSAGAITAATLAADVPIADLEEKLGGLDYQVFLSQKTSWLIRDLDPTHDLDEPAWMLANLQIAGELGQYRTQPFRDWLAAVLAQYGKQSFTDIAAAAPDRRLKVVVSDLTLGQMRVLPDDLGDYPLPGAPGDFAVAEAARLSMSIPLFFEPGSLGGSVIVDGGILSNFPLWIFDAGEQGGRAGVGPRTPPAWPTFGFRLLDRRQDEPAAIQRATDVLGAMVRTMMYAPDRRYLSLHNRNRAVDIDITDAGVTATEFGLSDQAKADLYRRGYKGTRDFLLNRWDWAEHLASRGFPTTPPGN